MGFLIVIGLLALGVWAIWFTCTRLYRASVPRGYWVAFSILIAAGLVAGVWLTLFFDYQVSDRLRFAGAPMPVAFFHLEDGPWIDFVTPPYIDYPAIAANAACVAAMSVLPLLLFRRVFRHGFDRETS